MKLKLYYFDSCPFCQIVLRKINALGLNDFIEFKNTLEDAQAQADHIKNTGRTTVPCLYIDDEPMFESNDIANWLEKNESQIRN